MKKQREKQKEMAKHLNKKAEAGTGISFDFLIRVILSAVVIIALIYAGAKLFGIFVSQKDQSTYRNFEQLASTIKTMENGDSMNYALFIDDDYALVGYESGKNAVEGTCLSTEIHESTTNTKPPACGIGTEGCLCLCKQKKVFSDICKDDKNIVCKTASDFGEDFSFIGGMYSDNILSCNFAYIQGADTPQKIFIEKNDKTIALCRQACSPSTTSMNINGEQILHNGGYFMVNINFYSYSGPRFDELRVTYSPEKKQYVVEEASGSTQWSGQKEYFYTTYEELLESMKTPLLDPEHQDLYLTITAVYEGHSFLKKYTPETIKDISTDFGKSI